jgi:hypothetical protein
VSLDSYLLWVRLSARNGLLLSTLRQNIDWALFLLLPVLLAHYAHEPSARPHGREMRWMLGALLAGLCVIVLAASKPGATAYHFVPFLPVIFYITAAQLGSLREDAIRQRIVVPAAAGFVASALVIALAQQVSFVRIVAERTHDDEVGDIHQFLEAHPGKTVEMGYGRDDRLTLVRPVLVFRNGSYLLDAPAVQEHQLSGLEVPQSTIEAIRACAVDYWLIPQGQEPFSGLNRYTAMQLKPLFSEEFRTAFLETYLQQDRTRYYDVWACRTRERQ